ncbi:MAG: hypothetical protein JXM70_23760 [Pirellulales bacterium]|nr:hypothetical protein [Pirellulales bacterium]
MHSSNDVFPLPLVAFERYMLADDRADYPMTFLMGLRLSGTVDRQAMEESLDEALLCHPLLRAVVDGNATRRPCWVAAKDAATFDWEMASVPLPAGVSEGIDLTTRPGLRAWARQGDKCVELTFQFHHTCCDGIGAVRFLTDLLRFYANRTANEEDRPVPCPTDVGRLGERARLGRHDESIFFRLRALLKTLPMTIKFITRRPRPLVPVPVDSEKPAECLSPHGILHVELGEEDTRRLRDACRREGVTLNDRLLRDMFLTIADWNRRSGKNSHRGWLRVLMPTNMRSPDDDAMPAANMVSMCFLTRKTGECEYSEQLMRGIHRETFTIKRIRRGLYFIRVIEAGLALCGKMPDSLVGRRCRATAVLSNLGDIGHRLADTFPCRRGRIVAGNLMLEGIMLAPPIRPNTTTALAVCSYADRLNVSLLCDRQLFSPQQTEQFMRDYTDRLHAPSGG